MAPPIPPEAAWLRRWRLASLALALDAAFAQGPPALSAAERTEHFTIHFRPGSRAEAEVDRLIAVVEQDLARILRELGLTSFAHRIDLYIYDDVAELQKITGVPSAGHSTTLVSHVPCANDQTRVHELVHVVAEQFAERGPESRNLFVAEGLANAVLRFVDGVPVDAVAAFYRRRDRLPALDVMLGQADFYGWLSQQPGLNAYDIAASWLRFLLDEHGAAKVRAYYKGAPLQQTFGSDLAALEKRWHARLDALALRPGALELLRRRAATTAAEKNRDEARLDAEVRGDASLWRPVQKDALRKGEPARWIDADGTTTLSLDGEPNVGDWCLARFDLPIGDAMARCIATPRPGCFGVQIEFGQKCQALLLRGQGTFIYTDKGGVAHDPGTQLGLGPVEIVLRRSKGRASVWIDGKLVAEGDVDGERAALAIGSVGGGADFGSIEVRDL